MRRPQWFKNTSIRNKFIYIAYIATLFAALFAVVVMSVLQWFMLREELVKEMSAKASIIASIAETELVSNNHERAQRALNSLSMTDSIEFAGILDSSGKNFALYLRPGYSMPPHSHLPQEDEGHLHTLTYLEVTVPLVHQQEKVGFLHVRSDLSPVYKKLELNIVIVLIAAAGALLVAIAMLMRLLPAVTSPLQHLVALTNSISRDNDFGVRAKLHGSDETGMLAKGFNHMLSQIQSRDAILQQQRDNLEQEVVERTEELQESNRRLAVQLAEQKISEHKLYESELAYRTLAQNLPGIVYRVYSQEENRIEFYNDIFEKTTGFTNSDLVGGRICPIESLIYAEDRPAIIDEIACAIQKRLPFTVEYRLRRKHGDLRWMEEHGMPFYDTENKLLYIDGLIFDVTERKQIEQALEESEQKFRTILDVAVDGVLLMDKRSGRFIEANRAICEMLGYRPDELYGLGISDIHPTEALSDALSKYERLAKGKIVVASDLPVKRKDSTVFFADVSSAPMILNRRNVIVSFFHDVTERKRYEEKMSLLATTDSLTGIANRREFNLQLEKEIDRARRYDTPLSLIMYDIDNFKQINDTFGHDVGDTILTEVTEVIKKKIRSHDLLARWGGEEFMILMPEADQNDGMQAAEKLRKSVEDTLFEQVGRMTISFGVTAFSKDDDSDDLLKRADNALYQAKDNGRNRVEAL